MTEVGTLRGAVRVLQRYLLDGKFTAIRAVVNPEDWTQERDDYLLREILRLSEDAGVTPARAADLAYYYAAAGFDPINIGVALSMTGSWLREGGWK